MADSRRTERPLDQTWLAFARLAAVGAGALTATVSLLSDVSPLVASGRGALTWLGIRILARISAALLAWAGKHTVPHQKEPVEQETAG